MIVTDIEILRSKSVDYDAGEHNLQDMFSTLELALERSEIMGAGLSMIQVGLPIRVCIIRTNKISLDLYNAKITSGSEVITFKGEGCLSIPGVYLDTQRMNKITVLNGDGKEYKLEGFEAVVVQHEISHWNGELIYDYAIDQEEVKKILSK